MNHIRFFHWYSSVILFIALITVNTGLSEPVVSPVEIPGAQGNPTLTITSIDSITTSSARISVHLVSNRQAFTLKTQILEDLMWSYIGIASTEQYFAASDLLDTTISWITTGLFPDSPYLLEAVLSVDTGFVGLVSIPFQSAPGSRGSTLIIPLTITDNFSHLYSLHLGVQTFATKDIDEPLGEAEYPPPFSYGTMMDPRFTGTTLGCGTRIDLRPFVTPAQVDTYRIALNAPDECLPITISWPALDSLYSGAIILHTTAGETDMKSTSSVVISDPDISRFIIYAHGPRPENNRTQVISMNTSINQVYNYGVMLALIYPIHDTTRFWFEWGKSMPLERRTPTRQLITKAPFATFEDTLIGFSSTGDYFLQTVTENENNIIYGPILSFQWNGSTSVINPTPLPQRTELRGADPNPFNPQTTIHFTLSSREFVNLCVYDVLGREIAQLVNEVKNAGEYAVPWNAGTNASGIYFYRMQTGSITQTKKIVLMK
jgi:hypothetical protein